ncbi:hypothetical protein BH23GEM10_BH23GEM10_01430 [soil metagenome]
MYSTCLFCSQPLGRNEAIEPFPVGTRVAFDAWRGRLWAVCRGCGRWNLAPIEERWEAVEAAEKLFADTRSRVHSENIGLARLADGTRLIRVGKALPGELAAWRYGGELVSRRSRNMMVGGAGIIAGGAILAGLPFIVTAGVPITLLSSSVQIAAHIRMARDRRKIVHVVPAAASPTGGDLVIRRSDLYDASLRQFDDGDFGIDMKELPPTRNSRWSERRTPERPAVQLRGDAARNVVSRAMVAYNHRGAKLAEIEAALRSIEQAGGAHEFAYNAAASNAVLTRSVVRSPAGGGGSSLREVLGTFKGEVIPVTPYRADFTDRRPRLAKTDALALEMALHEEAERHALEGELAALEAAWREAEEIAHIADALPGEPPPGRGAGGQIT